jgi:hypothetical protein
MMPYTPIDVRTQIIRQALQPLSVTTPKGTIQLWDPSAENLVLVTGAHESNYEFTQQIGGGPALGFFQMEPETHDDCWTNFLNFHPDLSSQIENITLNGAAPHADELVSNAQYAAAMCRVKYLRSPLPLPGANDANGMWSIYKAVYNTVDGAANQSQFMNAWDRWVSSNPIS